MSLGYSGRPLEKVVKDSLFNSLLSDDKAYCYGTTKHIDFVIFKGAGHLKSSEQFCKDIAQNGLIVRPHEYENYTAVHFSGTDEHEWDWDESSLSAWEKVGVSDELPDPRFEAWNPPHKSRDVKFTEPKAAKAVAKKLPPRVPQVKK